MIAPAGVDDTDAGRRVASDDIIAMLRAKGGRATSTYVANTSTFPSEPRLHRV
ncbi:MAG: hypothetical protein M0010_15405 [Actinomycetota bacterium]|jgi:hypothetical protein|nr:hypothetical protein [Actinomycetota bacterium]MDA8358404.1 hypothetical protein [Actinomycetota bacterium]